MSKRKAIAPPSNKDLKLYQKSYKGGGIRDPHYPILQDTLRLLFDDTKTVLYPGCHRHLTPALFFPQVTFVDYEKRVAPLYHPDNNIVKEYIDTHKVYQQESNYEFHCCHVHPTDGIPGFALNDTGNNNNRSDDDSKLFDLLISMSAGLLAESCTRYVKEGGFLLVNDAHSDARTVFANSKTWQLYAYWDGGAFTTDDLKRCFQVIVDKKSGTMSPITKTQVKESVEIGTVRKRSFKLLFEPMFYIFRKIK